MKQCSITERLKDGFNMLADDEDYIPEREHLAKNVDQKIIYDDEYRKLIKKYIIEKGGENGYIYLGAL